MGRIVLLLALDAMGGDHAPFEICRGAILACKEHSDLEVALVGRAPLIEQEIGGAEPQVLRRIHVVHTDEYITMDELPAAAMRKKKKASLRLAMEMVRSGEADGCISAGNTGAIVAGGILVIGRIAGIDRPGLGVPMPALKRLTLLIDVGATVRCKPLNLYQFAQMGSLYMRHVMNVSKPTVALLSNGEEEIKGDEVIFEAREMLSKSSLNFIGYVEGKDIPFGTADVIVCDGFTGNAMLKFIEGTGEALYALFKDEMGQRLLPKVGILFFLPMLKELWTRFDYEQYGGTPLLGVKGAVIKAHGRSKAPAIASALRVARNFIRQNCLKSIEEELAQGGV
ncbi:MAG: phosphate acyltransferase [Synergistaceae bacterium]|nr:MAG: Phosphate acyltransferase [Synergistales bacterium 54_24]MDI3532718.1 phosphate acyltransferase [Synergistaceae bacterium]